MAEQQIDPRVAVTQCFLIEVQTMHMRLSAIREQTLALGRVDKGERDGFNVAVGSLGIIVKYFRDVLGMSEVKVLRGAQGLDGKLEIVQ